MIVHAVTGTMDLTPASHMLVHFWKSRFTQQLVFKFAITERFFSLFMIQ